MKAFATFLILCFALSAFAQTTFTVRGFSDKYYGIVEIQDTSEVFSPGWVAIYDSVTKHELIKVISEELAVELHDGEVLANIISLPYGEQSVIIHNDFNFDGFNDFALEDGQYGCYHGPSYQVYLAKEDSFMFSPQFTELAQGYCGMFDVNVGNKTLHTMSKSGCCYHQLSEFIVEADTPKVIRIVTFDDDVSLSTTTEEKWDGEKMVIHTQTTFEPDPEVVQNIFSFRLVKEKKAIVLYTINEQTLNYVLIGESNIVEATFPANTETEYGSPDFNYSAKNSSIAFTINDTTYTIFDNGKKVEVKLSSKRNKSVWKGDTNNREGTLQNLNIIKPHNVVYTTGNN